MPALNFQKQFAAQVELYLAMNGAGGKGQTIRAKRKYPIRQHDKLYLYTGQ